ncbi:hypothetical protein [Holospora curviuscula]|uniref:J domain-containing protein n=1 Tax=Holospora curviuscula TaxID=1082868 RepID=A0A2S5R7S4_9PROT|nr:hypothetical protein [Holospora curviuscula]PPE03343.1 hypothetical protein HCUR_01225 [Holospora curviuscula]
MDFASIKRMDWFELFGLPKRFLMDLDVLEKAYLQKQKIVHPDSWGNHSSKVTAQLSAYINTVYTHLKTPSLRAEYMLKSVDAWPVPMYQEILVEIFTLKSQEDSSCLHDKYQEAIIKFDDEFRQTQYVQAQHAYMYICYLKQ